MNDTKSIIASGKTVKDAIAQGLNELGCDSDDVDVQIISMGSPGFMGLFGKLAEVKLTLRSSGDDFDIEMPKLSIDDVPLKEGGKGGRGENRKEKQRRAEKPAAEEKPSSPAAEEPAEEKREGGRSRKRRGNREAKREAREAREEVPAEAPQEEIPAPPMSEDEPFVVTGEEELTEESRNARDFLAGMTQRMGVPAQIEVCQAPDYLRMRMSGENMSILIGRRGETLDALQYLISLNANKGRSEYLRVNIDTENYRAKREEALRKLALRMAARAKKTGHRVALEPMNPYERRILHSSLQGDPDVTTHSEGEEPYRRVIITLK